VEKTEYFPKFEVHIHLQFMTAPKKIIAIVLAALWITLSEFVRNEFLFLSYWTDHYQHLGIVFPNSAVNGMIWMAWSFLMAVVIFILSTKFTMLQTTLLAWVTGYVLMWLVIGNLGVLPLRLLWFAVPLSMLEAFIATLIIKSFHKNSTGKDN
jgi:hypothetical protein